MKTIRMLLFGLLTLSLLASCEPNNENNEGENQGSGSQGGVKESFTETFGGLNLEMVYVEGGTFKMGGTEEQGNDTYKNEYPVRTIRLDSYYIGKYEITQKQWANIMGRTLEDQWKRNGIHFSSYLNGKGDDYPIYFITLDELQEFCRRLSERTGKKYMLPTEAQWEYAARGGNKSKHYKYSGSNDIDEVAWYSDNSKDYYNEEAGEFWSAPHPVGTKKANELGIYDMSGNMYEWCADWYGPYDPNDTYNPWGSVGSYSVIRGGSYSEGSYSCRVAYRQNSDYALDNFDYGFRVVCSSK